MSSIFSYASSIDPSIDPWLERLDGSNLGREAESKLKGRCETS